MVSNRRIAKLRYVLSIVDTEKDSMQPSHPRADKPVAGRRSLATDFERSCVAVSYNQRISASSGGIVFLGLDLKTWLGLTVVGTAISTFGALLGIVLKDYIFSRSFEKWKQRQT